jgi:hypothetical protein
LGSDPTDFDACVATNKNHGWGSVLMLCAAGAVVVFQREIRVAYHRNRMFAAMENYALLNRQSLTKETRMPTAFEELRFSLMSMSSVKQSTNMTEHENALVNLGDLEKREFTFTNKIVKGAGHFWPSFRQQVTNPFGDRHWWSGRLLETNRLAITATPTDMPKRERLISDFDR